MNELTFRLATVANMLRLPLFKTKQGKPAHTTNDGSDWSPSQWFEAFLGEVGEWCRVRCLFDAGLIDFNEYQKQAAKEAADIQIYFLIWCKRMLDTVPANLSGHGSPSQRLMEMMAHLGEYANERKKYMRGDLPLADFNTLRAKLLNQTGYALSRLFEHIDGDFERPNLCDKVTQAHPDGIDISAAVVSKFNEVSDRVKASVKLNSDDGEHWHIDTDIRRYY